MELLELNKTLRSMARENGLCDQWFGAWKDDTTREELINMYFKGMDFSVDKDWVSNEFIKENFPSDMLAERGVFIDEKGLKERNLPNVTFNGECEGELEYDVFNVGNVYVRHKSDVTITVWDFAKCFIEVYDKAKVKVVNYSNSRVFVYKHGGEVETEGDVLIRKK